MTREEQIFAYKELRKNGQVFVVDTYEDADRIIEALELTKELSTTNTSNPMYEVGYKKGASDMEKAKQIIINKLQEQIPKWHLCSEELPTKEQYKTNSGQFVVTNGQSVYVAWFDVGEKFFGEYTTLYPYFRKHKCVIAWMELPSFEEVE